MIFLRRNRNDENGNPIRPSEEWFEDARAATEGATQERHNHNADSNIYGHEHVRAALERLFYYKCAYCRSDITRMDWNVEHFRPKASVAERKNHPGYYWLTYEWSNLYPSCTFCNQRRRDKPIWGDLKYAGAAGKMDQFPLENENTRAMSHSNNVSQEIALLIDPCEDLPEKYFSYDGLGNIIALDKALKEKSRGLATIKIFNLWPRRLRKRRRDRIDMVVGLLKIIRELETVGNNSTADSLNEYLQINFLDDSCVDAGVSRAAINDPEAFGLTAH